MDPGLFDQMTSENGGQFSKAGATFAIKHVDADYKAEAVEAAESYLEALPMSRAALVDQMTSPYGGQFTQKQAEYAVKKVNL